MTARLGQDRLLGLDVEIDEHVAQENNVERRQHRPLLHQIEFAKVDQLAQVVPEFPLRALSCEVLYQEGSGQTAIHLELAVAASLGLGQDGGAKIGGDKFEIPRQQFREILRDDHHHAVRLLARGRRATPEVQLPLR